MRGPILLSQGGFIVLSLKTASQIQTCNNLMGALLTKLQQHVADFGIKKTFAAFLAALFLKSTLGRKLQYLVFNQPPGPMPLPIIVSPSVVFYVL